MILLHAVEGSKALMLLLKAIFFVMNYALVIHLLSNCSLFYYGIVGVGLVI